MWQRSFTNPGAGITQQSWSDTGCRDVNPDVGIVGTPVIDRAKDRLYVVVPTKENGTFHTRLHAISPQNGADTVTPAEVSASVMLAGIAARPSSTPDRRRSRSRVPSTSPPTASNAATAARSRSSRQTERARGARSFGSFKARATAATSQLFAFNADDANALHWRRRRLASRSGVGSIAGALITPLVANGKVYVPTDGGVAVFGLTGAGVHHGDVAPRAQVRMHLK